MAQTSKTLLDTSILVDYLRQLPPAVNFLDSLKLPCISVITGMEIIQGSRNKRELKINLSFLKNFRIVEIDNKISKTAMRFLKNYQLKYNAKILDAFIAATALSKNKILLTKNIKDFHFIDGINVELPY